MELYQSVDSSAIISGTETKVIDNIIEEREPVLHNNDRGAHMYGSIPGGCDNLKKLMGEVLSLLTGNGICNLLCE